MFIICIRKRFYLFSFSHNLYAFQTAKSIILIVNDKTYIFVFLQTDKFLSAFSNCSCVIKTPPFLHDIYLYYNFSNINVYTQIHFCAVKLFLQFFSIIKCHLSAIGIEDSGELPKHSCIMQIWAEPENQFCPFVTIHKSYTVFYYLHKS